MSQQWTEEPQSDDEDSTSAYESHEASDEEEADDSASQTAMKLLLSEIPSGSTFLMKDPLLKLDPNFEW